jgi:hypothetical protein
VPRPSAAVEDLQGLDEPLAALAEEVLVGDEAVLHHHLGGVGGADAELVLLLAGAEAVGAALDDERRDVVVARSLGIVDGEDDADIADRAVGGEGLGAVQDPAAVDLVGAAAGAGGVGAGAGLGEAPRPDPFSRRQRPHPLAALLVVAELVDVVGTQGVVGGDADPQRRVDLRQLGDHQDVVDVAEAGAAELLGEQDAEKAELAGLAHHVAGKALRLVDLVDDRLDLAAGEIACRVADGALVLVEGKIHESLREVARMFAVLESPGGAGAG